MAMRNKIFVGSLPQGTRPNEIRHLFENYGVVTECDVMNRCAFVHMQSSDMAENAIQALHNTTFNGVTINVEHGRSRERTNPNDSGGGRGAPRGQGGFRDRQGRGGFRQNSGDRPSGPVRNNQFRGGGGSRSEPYSRGRGGNFGDRNPRPGYNQDNGRNNRFAAGGGRQFNTEDRRGFALPNESTFSGATYHGGLAISPQSDPYTRRSVGPGAGPPSQGIGKPRASNYNEAFPPLPSYGSNRGPQPEQYP